MICVVIPVSRSSRLERRYGATRQRYPTYRHTYRKVSVTISEKFPPRLQHCAQPRLPSLLPAPASALPQPVLHVLSSRRHLSMCAISVLTIQSPVGSDHAPASSHHHVDGARGQNAGRNRGYNPVRRVSEGVESSPDKTRRALKWSREGKRRGGGGRASVRNEENENEEVGDFNNVDLIQNRRNRENITDEKKKNE